MNQVKKIVSCALALSCLTAVCTSMTSCGATVDGTYTTVVDSATYFKNEEVKADLAADPGKYVKFDRMYSHLNSNIADIGEGRTFTIKESGGVADFYTATLVLESTTYTLTKSIKVDPTTERYAAMGIPEGKTAKMKLTFSGTFENNKGVITLQKPDRVTGTMLISGAGAAYTRFGANFETVDVSSADADDIMYPGKFFYYFDSLYFVDTGKYEDMNVSVSKDTMTFTVE